MLLLPLSIYGCSTAVAKYNANPLTVVPAELSTNVIENAMLTALIGRKWTIQSRSQGTVVAKLKHRGYDATVTLQSDGSIIKILNESTYLANTINPVNTATPKPAVPVSWLINIQRDLRRQLQFEQYSTVE